MKYGKPNDTLETLAFSLTETIANYIRERSSQEDRSMSAIMRRIMDAEMERHPLPANQNGRPQTR